MKRIFLFLIFPIFLFSCESIKITMDYDNTVDFSRYKTYKFEDNVQSLPLNDLNKRRMIKAVEDQLTEKGFSKSEDPDVYVDLVISSREQQETYATTNYYGGGYRYGRGGGFSSTNVSTITYTVGTIFIDIIDAKKKQLVWQGRGEGTIEKDPKNREKNINYAVSKIFYNYPPSSK